ncbi:unnamed protein product [Rhodiola kirilowii]
MSVSVKLLPHLPIRLKFAPFNPTAVQLAFLRLNHVVVGQGRTSLTVSAASSVPVTSANLRKFQFSTRKCRWEMGWSGFVGVGFVVSCRRMIWGRGSGCVGGWALHRIHGGLTFLNLRDHTGLVQVTTLPNEYPEAHSVVMICGLEYVVSVEGFGLPSA